MHISISNDTLSCLPKGQNELELQKTDQVARQTRIQQLEFNYSVCAEVNSSHGRKMKKK